jgi:hypothetical protein
VTIEKVRTNLDLRLDVTEATVEGVGRDLTVVQQGGSLQARGIGGKPDLELSDADLEYAGTRRPPKEGRFVLRQCRARLRLPRRIVLVASGDTELIRSELPLREAEDLEQEGGVPGKFVSLEVDGGEVEVRPIP